MVQTLTSDRVNWPNNNLRLKWVFPVALASIYQDAILGANFDPHPFLRTNTRNCTWMFSLLI